MEAALDPELLQAFLPEWQTAVARLAEAVDAPAALRALDGLRGLAGAFGIASLRQLLAPLDPLPEPFDRALLVRAAESLWLQAEAIAAAGRDVALPEAPAPEPPPAGMPPGASADAPRRRHRALVVDDSAMMRRLVRETLDADPDFLVVGEAADGRAALDRMAELAPDLTMLDIEMPVLDGIGTLREWALAGGSGAVVIVSSAARPGSDLAVLARRIGAAAVVGKPSGAFSPDLRDRQGGAILRAARRALHLPVES
jgi:CheY-like chemotaxis protein